MMSAKFSGFLTPSPCLHLGLIYSTYFTQPPLLHLLLDKPPPPSVRTSYMDAPLRISGRSFFNVANKFAVAAFTRDGSCLAFYGRLFINLRKLCNMHYFYLAMEDYVGVNSLLPIRIASKNTDKLPASLDRQICVVTLVTFELFNCNFCTEWSQKA